MTVNLMILDLILWHSFTNQTRIFKTWLLEPELQCKFSVSFLNEPLMTIHEVSRYSQGKIIFSYSQSFWICSSPRGTDHPLAISPSCECLKIFFTTSWQITFFSFLSIPLGWWFDLIHNCIFSNYGFTLGAQFDKWMMREVG